MSKYIEAGRLKAKIERLKAAVKQNSIGKFTSVGFIRACDDILFTIDSESGAWIEVSEDHPLPYGQEVIGYNREWVNEDFNPSGTRIGFFSDAGFFSAKWVNDQDCYVTCLEEGDDYIISQMQTDGTMKTWCRYENGEAVEGHLPNMPTHYMLIPKTPDGFAWPYNTEKEK